jgi:sugar phosphate permease
VIASTAAPSLEAVNPIEKRAMKRVMWRVIPFLVLCYFVAYLDRTNISFAALHMNKDLGLSASAYGLGAGLFFVTYSLFEVPSNLLLYRFGARRWIARIMLTWGVCAGAMAFVTGALSYNVARLLLGAAEAGFYPGMLFFLTLWFPAAYRGRILAFALAALPLSGLLGSPISGLLLGLDGLAGLKGWQWLFLLEAAPAILLAPVVLLVLKDGPAHASWLPADEREWLSAKLEEEAKNVKIGEGHSVRQVLTNPWVLFLILVYFSNVCLLNGLQFFLPQIVKAFGLTDAKTGFVVAIPSLIGLATLMWYGRSSDKRQERYGHAAFANGIAAAALLAAMLVQAPALRIALISVCSAFTISFCAPFWSIPSTFLSRRAAASGIAAISGFGVLGGWVTPWIVGITKDRTGDFRIGLGGVAIFTLLVSLLFFVLGRARQARDRSAALLLQTH